MIIYSISVKYSNIWRNVLFLTLRLHTTDTCTTISINKWTNIMKKDIILVVIGFLFTFMFKKTNKQKTSKFELERTNLPDFIRPCLRLQAYRRKILDCLQTLKWEVKNNVKCLHCLSSFLLVSHFGNLTSGSTAMEPKT